MQANVRRIIKNTKKKKTSGGGFVTVGRETEIGQVWGMIKRMNGMKREFGYPVLKDGDTIAIKDEEKAKMLAENVVKIHKSDNISKDLIQNEEYNNEQLNMTFTKAELNRALRKTKNSAPAMDQICYLMLSHLSEVSKDVLLKMYKQEKQK